MPKIIQWTLCLAVGLASSTTIAGCGKRDEQAVAAKSIDRATVLPPDTAPKAAGATTPGTGPTDAKSAPSSGTKADEADRK